MTRIALSLLLLLTFTACGPRLIPGTEVQDTPETRALLLVMERFRTAVEHRDAKTLASLTDPSFYDQSGTPALEDDLDYAHLEEKLSARFARVQDVRVELDVRKIDIDEHEAKIIYYYTVSFRPTLQGAKGQRDSDLKQMTFVRADKSSNKDWKIASGI